jgi:hypothetical protein
VPLVPPLAAELPRVTSPVPSGPGDAPLIPLPAVVLLLLAPLFVSLPELCARLSSRPHAESDITAATAAAIKICLLIPCLSNR